MEIKETRDDEDWPDEDYLDEYDDADESDIVECPECGADVYEDAERCPTCDNYIVHDSSGYLWKDRPAWWIALGLIGILAVIVVLAFGPI